MDQQQNVVVPDVSGETVRSLFLQFLLEFRAQDNQQLESTQNRLMNNYKSQIFYMIQNDKATIFVDFKHVIEFHNELAEAIQLEYYRFEPYLTKSVQDFVGLEHKSYVYSTDKGVRMFFVSFYNLPRTERIRQIRSGRIGQLISLSGTVTRSSDVRPELLLGSFICRKCGTVHSSIEQQFQYTEPHICKNNVCKASDFQLNLDQSVFADWQRFRVQENAEEIPAGSMPRCIDVICRNDVVESAKAGDKIIFTGTVVIVPDVPSDKKSSGDGGGKGRDMRSEMVDGVQGLKKLGVKEMSYKMMFVALAIQHFHERNKNKLEVMMNSGDDDADQQPQNDISETELDEILQMKRSSNLYANMVASVSPSVSGHTEVKRGILLMLFGGVHKTTPEGISLRGDLNVCIVGDPSCAKSQFLKWVHEFLPRSVYTSGKSSSAAGLTASVVKDSETGEYCVEAGALMLADNGVCCIDEFDKMEVNDQVAIHEAMEQQTISIAKAGIQATLNARTSILAAANPIFGRYDRSKTLKANIAVSAPIMSRFDLFFIILDECNPDVDEQIARHIINNHRVNRDDNLDRGVPFSVEQMRKYIKFARTFNPALTPEGKKVLVECYCRLRQGDMLGRNRTAYRITVRQLESLIRLSEALARLHLDEKVKPVYIREAFRLLQKSIIFAEVDDVELDENEEEMDRRDEGDDEGDDKVEKGSRVDSETASNADTDAFSKGRSRRRRDDADEDAESVSSKRGKRRRQNTKEDAAEGELEEGQKRGTGENTEGIVREEGMNPEQEAGDSTTSTAAGARDGGQGGKGDVKGEQGDAKGEQDVQQKKEKKKTKIPFELYRQIKLSIEIYLKNQEELLGDSFVGVSWRDTIDWYITQTEDEVSSAEEIEQKKKLIGQVLRRMLKHEVNSIIEVVGQADDAVDDKNSNRLLRVSPSFSG